MGRVERLGDLFEQVERSFWLELAFAAQQLTQVGPFDVPHREIEDALFLAGSDDPDDMRMVEARRELRLTEEAPTEAIVPCQLRHEHLDGDPTASLRVLGEIDRAHRTLSDQGLQAKPGQDGAGTDSWLHRLQQE